MTSEAVRPFISGMAVGALTALVLFRFASITPIELFIVSIAAAIVLYQIGLLLLELVHGHPRAILGGWFAGGLIALIGLAVFAQNRPANPAFAPIWLVAETATRGLLVPILRKRLSRRLNRN
jgi:hypothetical protein